MSRLARKRPMAQVATKKKKKNRYAYYDDYDDEHSEECSDDDEELPEYQLIYEQRVWPYYTNPKTFNPKPFLHYFGGCGANYASMWAREKAFVDSHRRSLEYIFRRLSLLDSHDIAGDLGTAIVRYWANSTTDQVAEAVALIKTADKRVPHFAKSVQRFVLCFDERIRKRIIKKSSLDAPQE